MCERPLIASGRSLACDTGHAFDVAHQGYVNLLVAGQRRSRQPGDSREMVDARARFLATGAYDRVSAAVARDARHCAHRIHEEDPAGPVRVLDVGCGDGHHTRYVMGNMTRVNSHLDAIPARCAGIDVSKRAVALAARDDRAGAYAVASAADIPVPTASIDVAINIFGPVFPTELARVLRPGGAVVMAHPGPSHLDTLRSLVYVEAHPHAVKDPLRDNRESFVRIGSAAVTFPMTITRAEVLVDLFTMTPYRWHAPEGIESVLAAEARAGFTTTVDIRVSSYMRTPEPTAAP